MRTTIESDDRVAYAGYVDRMLAAFREHTHAHAFVFDMNRLDAARYVPASLDTTDHGAWKGPWHVTRKWVTTEFREWIEEYNIPRLTFGEWKHVAIEARATEAAKATEYLESAAYCLDELDALHALQARRDELIMAARERGASWAEIGESVGMSRAQLHNIATKHGADMAAAQIEIAQGVPADWDEETPF